jgi:hypothetical protein
VWRVGEEERISKWKKEMKRKKKKKSDMSVKNGYKDQIYH